MVPTTPKLIRQASEEQIQTFRFQYMRLGTRSWQPHCYQNVHRRAASLPISPMHWNVLMLRNLLLSMLDSHLICHSNPILCDWSRAISFPCFRHHKCRKGYCWSGWRLVAVAFCELTLVGDYKPFEKVCMSVHHPHSILYPTERPLPKRDGSFGHFEEWHASHLRTWLIRIYRLLVTFLMSFRRPGTLINFKFGLGVIQVQWFVLCHDIVNILWHDVLGIFGQCMGQCFSSDRFKGFVSFLASCTPGILQLITSPWSRYCCCAIGIEVLKIGLHRRRIENCAWY